MAIINGNYREFKLDNGLHVALQETPTQTICGRLRINSGALNEEPGQEGLAHFLEHVLVNGGSRKFDISKIRGIRASLGYNNASTSKDETNFIIDILPQDIDMSLEFMADSTFYPRLDEKSIDIERQRVLREISDYKSAPYFRDMKTANEALYGKDSPHIYSALGKEEVIAIATQEDLRKLHEKGFCSDNSDIILVGALPENIEELVKKHFTNIPRGKKQKFNFPRIRPLKNKTIIHTPAPDLYNHDNPEQSNAFTALAFLGPTETDKDSYATRVLATILAGNNNSRIPLRIADAGLSYHVNCVYQDANNDGLLTFKGNVHSKRINEALDLIFEQFKKTKEDLVYPGELDLLKKQLAYQFSKEFETNSGHAGAIEIKMDKGLTADDFIKGMSSVTPEQIREAANKYLPADRESGKYVLLIRDPLKE